MDAQEGSRTLGVLRLLCPIRLDRFDDRLRMQKMAFLIQEVGGYHDFGYYWHIRGPNSPELTRVLFAELENGNEAGGRPPAEEDRILAGRVKSLVHGRIDDPLALELYASVWYLTPEGDLPDGDRAAIIETMRCSKPHFAREQVDAALAEIEAFRRDGR